MPWIMAVVVVGQTSGSQAVYSGVGDDCNGLDGPVPKPTDSACTWVSAVVISGRLGPQASGRSTQVPTVADGVIHRPLDGTLSHWRWVELGQAGLTSGPLLVCAAAGSGRRGWHDPQTSSTVLGRCTVACYWEGWLAFSDNSHKLVGGTLWSQMAAASL